MTILTSWTSTHAFFRDSLRVVKSAPQKEHFICKVPILEVGPGPTLVRQAQQRSNYSLIFHHFNLKWKTRTLEAFTQAA
jgi:hypothetical protein